MSSNGTRSQGGSAVTFADESTRGGSRSGPVAPQRVVPDGIWNADGGLACAAAAIERAEHELDRLWRRSMTAVDPGLAQRFAEVSHVLHQAACVLQRDVRIG